MQKCVFGWVSLQLISVIFCNCWSKIDSCWFYFLSLSVFLRCDCLPCAHEDRFASPIFNQWSGSWVYIYAASCSFTASLIVLFFSQSSDPAILGFNFSPCIYLFIYSSCLKIQIALPVPHLNLFAPLPVFLRMTPLPISGLKIWTFGLSFSIWVLLHCYWYYLHLSCTDVFSPKALVENSDVLNQRLCVC